MNERMNPLLEMDKIIEGFQDRVPTDMVRLRLRRLQESLAEGCESDWRNFAVDLLGGRRKRLNDNLLNEFFKNFGVKARVQSIRYRKTCIEGEGRDMLRVKGIETSLAGVTLELWQHFHSRTNHHPWVRVTAILDEHAKAASISPTLSPLSISPINELKT